MARIADDTGTYTKCVLDPYHEELSSIKRGARPEDTEREVAIQLIGRCGLRADEVVEEVLPGSGSTLDDRHEALTAAMTYLVRHGSATRVELSEEVYPEHTGRYESGIDPAYSWWKNCILPGLSAIAERSDEVEAADHSGVWRYHPQVP